MKLFRRNEYARLRDVTPWNRHNHQRYRHMQGGVNKN
jgi:hypothetical protein